MEKGAFTRHRWEIAHFMKEVMQVQENTQLNSKVFPLYGAPGLKFSLNFVPRQQKSSRSALWLFARDLNGLKEFHFKEIVFWLENAKGNKFGLATGSHTFKHVDESFGYPEYLTRCELNEFRGTVEKDEPSFISCYLSYNVPSNASLLSVQPPNLCAQSEVKDPPPIKSPENAQLEHDFRHKLWDLHSRGIYDCILRLPDKDFKVSKFILMAQSPVFERLFKSGFGEQTTILQITNFSSGVMEHFIEWLYFEKLNNFKNVPLDDLFRLAVKYKVLPLKEKCVTWMITTLSTGNALSRQELARANNEERLLKSTTSFIARRLGNK